MAASIFAENYSIATYQTMQGHVNLIAGEIVSECQSTLAIYVVLYNL